MTEKEKQPKLFSISETGKTIKNPDDIKKYEVVSEEKKPMYTPEEIEELYKDDTPHSDRGYN